MTICLLWYSKRDLNPHSHHWPKDFKSFVSTDSTIRAAFDRGGNGSIPPSMRCKGMKILSMLQQLLGNLH